MVVELIKRTKNAVTLAIGDGANDVSMIKGINCFSLKKINHIHFCVSILISGTYRCGYIRPRGYASRTSE